jgi:hypothetical protein
MINFKESNIVNNEKTTLLMQDSEWLIIAKQSLIFGIKKFTLPLLLIFWILDWMIIQQLIWWSFAIRFLSFPIALLIIKYILNANSRSAFVSRYYLLVLLYSIVATGLLFIYNIADVNIFNYICLVIFFTASQSIFTLRNFDFFIISVTFFLPFYILTYIYCPIPATGTAMTRINPTKLDRLWRG